MIILRQFFTTEGSNVMNNPSCNSEIGSCCIKSKNL